jgi:hypothetical protein
MTKRAILHLANRSGDLSTPTARLEKVKMPRQLSKIDGDSWKSSQNEFADKQSRAPIRLC